MIDFNDVPKVALDFMNNDHEEATNLVNQIQALIDQAQSNEIGSEEKTEEITAAFKALLEHNREHFAREEAKMREFNFPPYPVHKGEHERVLAEMESVLAAWQANQDLNQLKQYIDGELLSWFINHIQTMDTMTAVYISRSGG